MQGFISITSVILIACLIQAACSVCAEGTFINPYHSYVNNRINCTNCLPFCKTCNSTVNCLTWKDGYFRGVIVKNGSQKLACEYTNSFTSKYGYNRNEQACSLCAEGCLYCFIDYDYCIDCKAGWDWDKSGKKCLKANFGITAVVLALSALGLMFGIFAFLFSCIR